MTRHEMYEQRLSLGLCQCGERNAPGKTRCMKCLQFEAVKAKLRYDNRTEEEKKARAEYMREYMKRPKPQARLKERGKYYQRRYNGTNLYEEGYPWE